MVIVYHDKIHKNFLRLVFRTKYTRKMKFCLFNKIHHMRLKKINHYVNGILGKSIRKTTKKTIFNKDSRFFIKKIIITKGLCNNSLLQRAKSIFKKKTVWMRIIGWSVIPLLKGAGWHERSLSDVWSQLRGSMDPPACPGSIWTDLPGYPAHHDRFIRLIASFVSHCSSLYYLQWFTNFITFDTSCWSSSSYLCHDF